MKYIYRIQNWFIGVGTFFGLLWSKVRIYFGHEYDKSVIPRGMYCYAPDFEKNSELKDGCFDEDGKFHYYIKPCPHYKWINDRYRGCKYLGMITDDFIFADQCKSCGENYDMSDDEI
jgi:hypothetical protein